MSEQTPTAVEPWHTPRGGLIEAQGIARRAYKDIEAEKAINSHIPGYPYDVALSSLNPVLAALDTLLLATPTPAPEGLRETVRLGDCPPGLFMFDGCLGLKTEYGGMETIGPVDCPGSEIRWTVGRYSDVYVADSGETFWGGVADKDAREDLLVRPIDGILGNQPVADGTKPNAIYYTINAAECEVETLKNDYLRRHQWAATSCTPGSYWMWRRSFADVNARRAEEHAAFCARIGQNREQQTYPAEMLVDTDTAVRMTWAEIDPARLDFELGDS